MKRAGNFSIWREVIRLLDTNIHMKMPCIWQHSNKGSCTGHTIVGLVKRETGKKDFITSCRGGTFYIWRIE